MAHSVTLMLLITVISLGCSASCKHSASSFIERRYEINMRYGSLKLLNMPSMVECAIMCMSFGECGAINYNDGNDECELLETTRERSLLPPETPKISVGWETYSMKARNPVYGLCSLLSNGGFEENKDWTSVGTGYTYTAAHSMAGSRSIEIGPNGAATQSIVFKEGITSFTVAAWSKCSSLSPSANSFYGITADVTFHDGSTVPLEVMRFPDVTSLVWQQQVKRIDAPAGRRMTSARVILELDNYVTGKVFYDNVIVGHGDLTCEAVTGDPSRLCVPYFLPDPSFETGTAELEPFGNQGFTYTTEDAHGWSRSVKVVDGSAAHRFQFPADSGVWTVTVQAYSKPSQVPGPASWDYSILCDHHTANGTWASSAFGEYPVSGAEWTLNTATVTAEQNTDYYLCYLMYRGYASGHAYFDDVKVFVDGMLCM